MALSVCLLLDDRADGAVRDLWLRLESDGIGTLLTHTHGRHRPHLTLATLLDGDVDALRAGLGGCRDAPALRVRFDALGMFRRSRCWLVPEGSRNLLERQERVVHAATFSEEAVLHRNYEPGAWTPHLTLAPRLHLDQLPVVARHAFEILPVHAVLGPLVVVDTTTGQVHPV